MIIFCCVGVCAFVFSPTTANAAFKKEEKSARLTGDGCGVGDRGRSDRGELGGVWISSNSSLLMGPEVKYGADDRLNHKLTL